jgi:hypothetical protein
MHKFLLIILTVLGLGISLPAQSPVPIIVPAAAPSLPAKAPAAVPVSDAIPALLKTLQEMKSTNEETLRKQEAALEQLDELEKIAEQIRLYTRRS